MQLCRKRGAGIAVGAQLSISDSRMVPPQGTEHLKHKRIGLGVYAAEKREEMEELIETVLPHAFIVCRHKHRQTRGA